MSSNNSFTLPPLDGQTSTKSTENPAPAQETTTTTTVTQMPAPVVDISGPSTKSYIFGGVILLVLAVLFFLAAQLLSNHLVKKKHKPSSANTAAIWLFFLLFDLAVIAVVGIFDAGLLSLLQLSIPLAVLAIVFAILLYISARK
ncbi:hypothetical protein HF670_07310 [Acidithiobacillus thiooxidans]|jgi:phage-related holin|uniref:hypothetical protein n=1 Tax=Acidithiobacillus thiooxidans TaxID=930 RepID=UPI001C07DE70|nr:hypothetical protein [Acidithiobacillus thiooxidans]MBU2839373.1 hypothetical protein [Acidithiobacillus thiooxidans]